MKKQIVSLTIALSLVLAITPFSLTVSAQATVNKITATTAEELQNAIASNTEITLTGMTYTYENYLEINDVENLTIIGIDGTRIVSTSSDNDVITITNCTSISIKNVYIGHDLPTNSLCSAGVVNVYYSEAVTFENCDIFGCGAFGFDISDSNAYFKNCIIRDCSIFIGYATSSEIAFDSCIIKGNGYENDENGEHDAIAGGALNIQSNTLLIFNDCHFENNNINPFIDGYEWEGKNTFTFREMLEVNNCTFVGNTWGNTATTSTTPTTPIDTADAWARPHIESALKKGFIPDDIQNNYKNIITRQEFCRMAVKWVEYALGKNIDTILTEHGLDRNPNAFTDTSDPDILSAYALGITSGTGDGKFSPDGEFTREEAAYMIRNTCRAIGADVTNHPQVDDFYDTAGRWSTDGIRYIRANGIMSGTGDGFFRPTETFTRQESITTFNNINHNDLLG